MSDTITLNEQKVYQSQLTTILWERSTSNGTWEETKVCQNYPKARNWSLFGCYTVTQTGDVCQNYQSEGQHDASVERPKKSSEPFRVGGRLARSWTNMALLLIVPGRALECANTIPYIFTIP